MSNSPNMSYCAFENTLAALYQIRNMLSTAVDEGEPLDLNDYEARSYSELKSVLEELSELVDQHNDVIRARTAYEHEEDC